MPDFIITYTASFLTPDYLDTNTSVLNVVMIHASHVEGAEAVAVDLLPAVVQESLRVGEDGNLEDFDDAFEATEYTVETLEAYLNTLRESYHTLRSKAAELATSEAEPS